ncbi:MAG: type II/IV secretion system ATPase subunit, partial [Chlamydiia bacterium]|nr:type II/IV secretion system ATPase subunit [Chlamydiia bacterium]
MKGGSIKEDYEILREGGENTLKIDANNANYLPSVEDSSVCMSDTIEKLAKVKNVTRLVFDQKREFEYNYEQTSMLLEISYIYLKLTREHEKFSLESLNKLGCEKLSKIWYTELKNIIFNIIKADPIGAYVKLKRMVRHENSKMLDLDDQKMVGCVKEYIRILDYIMTLLEGTRLIRLAKPYISGFKIGDREVYRMLFAPTIKPDFMFTKLMADYPENAEELANYNVGNTEVVIFKLDGSVKYMYHMTPPEFKLSEEKYELLDNARNIMAEHKPSKDEFTDPERMREVFSNVGRDLIEELARSKGLMLREKEIEELTAILVRYTIGFGLIEVLLEDDKIQDVSINSPLGSNPMYIVHGDVGDCTTNIIPTRREAESWASKLRMISGRPLDEANPLLDTELTLPGATARVSAVNAPLAPTGLAFSFRRHRDKPWTLPLFIKYKMITPLAAGLMSFLIDGTRTMLISGTRSSGKTSLLGSLLIEIMRRYRIITIEDTFELPTVAMRKLGWNIQPLKVASALAKKGGGEVDATEGIRSTLRLGDSALIVGEVRSDEAKALYEAMRIGAAANVVAGTVHADSPYGVYDRVVNDIGVPKTSFKATDIIIVANPIKSADGIHRFRRVTEIAEVTKTWENDPLTENGFITLMKYNVKNDKLEATAELL